MKKNLQTTSYREFVESLTPTGMKHGRDHVREIMKYLGNPQDSLRVFHVAGSNGKGSVCQMISQVLWKGFHKKIGLFTSPHLIRINERFQINGVCIDDATLEKYYERVLHLAKKLDITLAFFEIQVVVMVLYFIDQKVDYAVVEVGLGGTYDATNIFRQPLACYITSITYEHTHILGKSRSSILRNKLGIVHGDTILHSPFNNKILRAHCRKVGAHFNTYRPIYTIHTNLPGDHQGRNAFMVYRSLMELDFDGKQILQTLQNISNPGRCDWIAPNILVDTANNAENIKILAKMITKNIKSTTPPMAGQEQKAKRRICILSPLIRGAGGFEELRKKDDISKTQNQNLITIFGTTQTDPLYAAKLANMVPCDERILVDGFCERALPCSTYVKNVEFAHIYHLEKDHTALLKLLKNPKNTIVVYGSLYLVGKIMQLLEYKILANE